MMNNFSVNTNGLVWGENKDPIDPNARDVQAAKKFLRLCQRTVSSCPWGSYHLKHLIENWAGEYVSNGATIRAALDLGLRVRPYDNLNAMIGVSKKSVKALLISSEQ